jgi:hypothetical protein
VVSQVLLKKIQWGFSEIAEKVWKLQFMKCQGGITQPGLMVWYI